MSQPLISEIVEGLIASLDRFMNKPEAVWAAFKSNVDFPDVPSETAARICFQKHYELKTLPHFLSVFYDLANEFELPVEAVEFVSAVAMVKESSDRYKEVTTNVEDIKWPQFLPLTNADILQDDARPERLSNYLWLVITHAHKIRGFDDYLAFDESKGKIAPSVYLALKALFEQVDDLEFSN